MTKLELLQLQNEHRERNYEDEYYNTPIKNGTHGQEVATSKDNDTHKIECTEGVDTL